MSPRKPWPEVVRLAREYALKHPYVYKARRAIVAIDGSASFVDLPREYTPAERVAEAWCSVVTYAAVAGRLEDLARYLEEEDAHLRALAEVLAEGAK